MTERKEDIRRLLDRYMAGDTTLEEEARLADYFRSPGADKEFAAFRIQRQRVGRQNIPARPPCPSAEGFYLSESSSALFQM